MISKLCSTLFFEIIISVALFGACLVINLQALCYCCRKFLDNVDGKVTYFEVHFSRGSLDNVNYKFTHYSYAWKESFDNINTVQKTVNKSEYI